MPYKIEERDGYVAVDVWGATGAREMLQALIELKRRYPRKEISDLWQIDRGTVVPFAVFPEIVATIAGFCDPDTITDTRTAIVLTDAFQRAQFELYRGEASRLPFEIEGFASHEEAVRWITGRPAVPAADGASRRA